MSDLPINCTTGFEGVIEIGGRYRGIQTTFSGAGGPILILDHDTRSLIIPEGVTADHAAREFVALANRLFLGDR